MQVRDRGWSKFHFYKTKSKVVPKFGMSGVRAQGSCGSRRGLIGLVLAVSVAVLQGRFYVSSTRVLVRDGVGGTRTGVGDF